MSPKRLVSLRQMVLLTEFLERHQELTHGKMMSREAIAVSSRLWRQCAFILNAEGESRTPKEWQKWFTDYKSRLLSKGKQRKKSLETGGESNNDYPQFSRLEEKLYSMLSHGNGKRGKPEISSKKRLVSVRQMLLLTEFLEEHQELALGRMRSREALAVASRLWRQCASILNVEGETRTPKEWQKWFTDYKSRLLNRGKQRNHSADGDGDCSKEHPPFSRLEERLFTLMSQGNTKWRKPPEQDPNSAMVEDQIKKETKMVSHYKQVKKICIELVRIHRRPADLFDDDAFKQLLQLIPMTTAERNKISAKQIIKYVQKDNSRTNEVGNQHNEVPTRSGRTEETQADTTLKNEGQCNCNTSLDLPVEEEDSPRHDVTCPAAANQPYWNYFQVSLDEATCAICKLTISWTEITDLREHLNRKHCATKYADTDISLYDVNDISLERNSPTHSTSTHEEMQQIYLDEPPLNDEGPSSAKKLKNNIKRAKSPSVLESFKNLDRFGMYIASLMRLIPQERCLKFQVQIVERLVEEARQPLGRMKTEVG